MQSNTSKKMRFGFNVNGASLGDEGYFLSVIGKLKPTTVLIMDNMDLALKVADMLGDQSHVIHRKYENGDGEYWLKRTPKQVSDMLMANVNGRDHKNIWKQVMNEPMARGADWKKLTDWCAEVGRYMSDNGHKTVLGNLAVGTYELSDVQGGYFDNLIRLAGERKDSVSVGIHEYTGFLLPFGIGLWDRWSLRDPAFVQPAGWPESSKIPEYRSEYGKQYYHLMRSTWLQVRAKEINALQHQIHLTEFGWDRLPDLTYGQNHIYSSLENKFGVPSPYTEMRGAYTYGNLWKAYYPQWSTAKSIIEQFKWADSVYPEWYTGFMPFMWSFGGDWEKAGFNFGADKDLHSLMIEWSAEINKQLQATVVPPAISTELPPLVVIDPVKPADTPATPTQTTFPLGDARWIKVFLSSTSNASNVRQTPVTTAPRIAVITKDNPALILVDEKLSKSDGVWYPIRLNVVNNSDHSNGDFSNFGWVRADVFTFKVKEPDFVPPPPEDYNNIAVSVRYLVTDAKQKSLAEAVKSLAKAMSLSGAVVAWEETD